MKLKMSHLFGGILGGVVFGLTSGLLLGSCVFEGGPNHTSATIAASPMTQEEAGPSSSAPGGMPPGGMDPGGASMQGVFAQIAGLKQRIEKDPRDRVALMDLGNMYYDAGKFDQATLYYEKAAAIDRNDPNLLTDLANCYMFQQDFSRALELLREVQGKFPTHWQSAANLFYLAVSQKDAPLAKEALDRLKGLNPNFEKLQEMEKAYEDLNRGGRS